MRTDVAEDPASANDAEDPAHEPIDPSHGQDVPAEAERVNPQPPAKSSLNTVRIVSAVALVLILFFLWHLLAGRHDQAATTVREPVVPVEIAAVTQRDVPLQIKGIGNVEALSTISVRSEIEGTLQNVFFTPGQEVKKGDLLFRIDPRPLQAALSIEEANLIKAVAAVKQAQAVVAKDQATATNSRVFAERQSRLVETGVIARQDYDNAVAADLSNEAAVKADQESVDNLQAAVKAQQAVVTNARVQLSYTDIGAPLAGKTGDLAVTAGNLVQPNSATALVTITQTSPIYVTFSVPEQELRQIRQYQGADGFSVQVFFPGDSADPATGKLSLIDNTVDPSTGTIKLKATFENGDRRLFPGQFVNVVLTLAIQRNATVVPSQAVQIGQDQQFVYVVKPDMTVEVRKVKPGDSLGGMTVIKTGLSPGEQAVTDGQLSLVPGAKVQPKGGVNNSGNGGGQNGHDGGAGGKQQ
jgi:multidrug efflux system membrane fusion protein